MPPKTEGKRLTLDGFHELMLKDPWYTHQYILYIRVIDGHLCYTRGEGYRRTIDDFLKEIVKKGIDLVDPQDRQIAEAAALYRANLSGEKTQHSHAYQFHLNILKLRFYGARLPKEAENFGKIWSAIQQSKSEAYKVCAEALAFQHGWNRTINFYAALDRYQEAQKLANGAEKIPVFKLIIDAYETKQYDDVIKSTLGAEPADVIMAFFVASRACDSTLKFNHGGNEGFQRFSVMLSSESLIRHLGNLPESLKVLLCQSYCQLAKYCSEQKQMEQGDKLHQTFLKLAVEQGDFQAATMLAKILEGVPSTLAEALRLYNATWDNIGGDDEKSLSQRHQIAMALALTSELTKDREIRASYQAKKDALLERLRASETQVARTMQLELLIPTESEELTLKALQQIFELGWNINLSVPPIASVESEKILSKTFDALKKLKLKITSPTGASAEKIKLQQKAYEELLKHTEGKLSWASVHKSDLLSSFAIFYQRPSTPPQLRETLGAGAGAGAGGGSAAGGGDAPPPYDRVAGAGRPGGEGKSDEPSYFGKGKGPAR